MKNNYLFLLILVIIFNFQKLEAQTYRYTNTIFPSSDKIGNIVYGNAPFLNSSYYNESATTNADLIMDIYQPSGDTHALRPAIIFAHGGGFSTGSRTVDDVNAFCDTFARKGFVTATIDYRQGVEVTDNGNLHYTRAAYRGLQDGRSAVRFLRANALTYGIDPDKIYWGGNSAGSFIGLNAIYMDADEKPTDAGAVNYTIGMVPYTGPDLGNLDIGNSLSENGEPDAVMACWGGVGDVSQIEAENNQNVFLVHGTADGIVPFNSGPPFGLSGINDVYGSNAINTQLSNLGIPAQMTYFVDGEDHEFYGVDNGDWENGTNGNAYWDIVVEKATDFYASQFKPTADFTSSISDLEVTFSDLSTNAISWIWDFGDTETSTMQNPIHTYASSGEYEVMLYIENENANWDTISQVINIVSPPMSGIYSVGFGASNDYTSLYHALNDLHDNGVSGAVVFELASDYNTSSDAYPVNIRAFAGASETNNLTIRPATGTSHVFERNSIAVFSVNEASHIIIDGSNNGTDSKDITVSNTSINDNTSAIVLYNNGNPGEDITIKNCIIKGGTKEKISSGIFSDYFTNVTIQNNEISRARTGIYTLGDDVSILNNEVGSENTDEYLHYGISVEDGSDITIGDNKIYNLIDDQDFDAIHAIALNNITGNSQVNSNFIDELIHTGNNVVQAIAILNCIPTEMKIMNNRVSNIASNSFENNYPTGIAIKCPTMTSGMKIMYNSINIPQNTTYGIGTGGNNTLSGGVNIGAGTGIEFKNNIISNTLGERAGAVNTTFAAAILVNSSTSPFAANGNDNNLFYVAGNNDATFMAMNSDGTLSLSDWQIWTNGGANSFFDEALFISNDDLNLQACSPAVAHAVYNAEYDLDIEDNARDTQYPTMGAYEYEKVQASNLMQQYPVKEVGWVMLSWQNGNGCKSVIFMKEGDFITNPPAPENGVTYTPNVEFGLGTEIGTTGWFCVGNQTSANTFTETTVVNGVEYTEMVCEYYGSEGNEIYLTEASTNNPILVYGDNSGNVQKFESQSIKINPNPTRGKVVIDLKNGLNFKSIKISDITGKEIFNNQYSIKNNKLELDLSDYRKGIYFIKLESEEGIFIKKLILK